MSKFKMQEKRDEFEDNLKAITDNAEGKKTYDTVFRDQRKAENLMASGGGENLGSLENELSALSAMNEIRMSERQQAFTNDKLFADDVVLNMRDASYIEASEELNRRRNIKSHRWDKTRKNVCKKARKP